MPATGFGYGTPASMSAIEVEQTEPIDEEPLDSSVSQTMRTVYGNLSHAGIIALIERSASAPWPISRRLLAAHAAGLADRVRREVVVEHELAHGVLEHRIDDLLVVRRAESHGRENLRFAAGEERRAVRAREEAGFHRDRADRLRCRGRRCGILSVRIISRIRLYWSSSKALFTSPSSFSACRSLSLVTSADDRFERRFLRSRRRGRSARAFPWS